MAKSVVAKTFTRPTPTGPYTWGNHAIPLWSDPNTWGGTIPARGADITISDGQSVLLDGEYVQGRVHVNGTLRVTNYCKRVGLRLKDGHAHGSGEVLVGSAADRFLRDPDFGPAYFRYYGDPPASPPESQGYERGFMVMDNGKFKVYAGNRTRWLKLGDHAADSATSITLSATPTGWSAQDDIIVGPSDYYGTPRGATELRVLASDVSSTAATLQSGLTAGRWGKLQYLTDSGWSLTAETFTYFDGNDSSNFPTILDERAPVGNLTCDFEIQGEEDSHWLLDGFGAHMMVMSRTTDVVMDGVGFRRCGQQGILARYPIHWHMLSYDHSFISSEHLTSLSTAVTLSPPVGTTLIVLRAGAQSLRYAIDGSTPTASVGTAITARQFSVPITTGLSQVKIIEQTAGGDVWVEYHGGTGAYLGDMPTGQALVKNCVIRESSQRGIIVHGTCGVVAEDNILYDIKGHAWFLEDGSERRNAFRRNLVLKLRDMPDGNLSSGYPRRLQDHEKADGSQKGPAGVWGTNPDNEISENHFADCACGIWWATAQAPMGLSKLVSMYPLNITLGLTYGNTNMSVSQRGRQFEGTPSDSIANATITTLQYRPHDDETPSGNDIRFSWSRETIAKCPASYINRTGFPDYTETICADNAYAGFSGATLVPYTGMGPGTITRSILSGESLNNATASPWTEYADQYTNYLTSRTGAATYHGTLVFVDVVGVNMPVVSGKLVGLTRANDLYTDPVYKFFADDSNVRLINATFGVRPLPGLITGHTNATFTPVLAGAVWDEHGFWGVPNRYNIYELEGEDPGNQFLTYGAADLTDCTPVIAENKLTSTHYYGVDRIVTSIAPELDDIEAPLTIVRRNPSTGATVGTWAIPGDHVFRHFSAANGGEYLVSIPGYPTNTDLEVDIDNCYRTGDSFVVGWPFTATPTSVSLFIISASPATSITMTSAADLAEVKAAAGTKYWYDSANGVVWVKIVGSIWDGYSGSTTYIDPHMKTTRLAVRD